VPARCKCVGMCDCVGVNGSWLDSRGLPYVLGPPASKLTLRASIRPMAVLGLARGSVLLSGSMLCRMDGELPLICTLVRREGTAAARMAGLAMLALVSHKAMQSSVRLRQMLSALRRTCRSGIDEPLRIELAECSVPCGPALPVISANVRASDAVASSTR